MDKMGMGFLATTLQTLLPLVLTPLAETESDRNQVSIGTSMYDFPSTVQVMSHTQTGSKKSTNAYDSTEEYSRSVAAELGVTGSTPAMSFGGRARMADAVRTSLSQGIYVMQSSSETLSHKATINNAAPLAPDFEMSVQLVDARLPSLKDEQKQNIMKQFFESWGTHYVRQGFFGGSIKMLSKESYCTSSGERLTTASIEAEGSKGFTSKATVGGDVKSSTEIGSSDSSSATASFDKFEVTGGDLNIFRRDGEDAWSATVASAPELVKLQIAPIWTLLSEYPILQRQLEDYYPNFMEGAAQAEDETEPLACGDGRDVSASVGHVLGFASFTVNTVMLTALATTLI